MDAIPSGREMADVAVEQGAIDMAQGVVHRGPPRIFLDLLEQQFDQRRLHIYASPAGYKGYREALLAMLGKEHGTLTLESIMAANGATGGLVSALRAHCKPLDHVLLLEPFYPAHDWAVQSLHLVPQYVPYTKELAIDMEQIAQALPAVTAFVLVNPGNPTGTVITADDLLRIYELCKQHDVLLIVDEVYKDFIWEGSFASLLSLADDLKNLVILRSFSKNLALAGWRAGYAVTTPVRRAQMTHIHDALYVGAPTAAQFVLAELLTNHQQEIDEFVRRLVQLYGDNREVLIDALQKFGMEPQPKEGTYYMMVQHKRESDLTAMNELLGKGIAVAPGMPFYRPGSLDTGHIRIHFALNAEDRDKVIAILEGSAAKA